MSNGETFTGQPVSSQGNGLTNPPDNITFKFRDAAKSHSVEAQGTTETKQVEQVKQAQPAPRPSPEPYGLKQQQAKGQLDQTRSDAKAQEIQRRLEAKKKYEKNLDKQKSLTKEFKRSR